PLDLVAHQPLHEWWEIDVEPTAQHRPQHVLDQRVDGASTARKQHGGGWLAKGAIHHRVGMRRQKGWWRAVGLSRMPRASRWTRISGGAGRCDVANCCVHYMRLLCCRRILRRAGLV